MTIHDHKLPPDLAHHAQVLEASGECRILWRLPRLDELWFMTTPISGPDITLGIIDCETTGLGADARVIEIAVTRMSLVDGQMCDLTPPVTMLEDPGIPLGEDIQRITGLRDADLAGKRFNEALLAETLGPCDALLAFNAAFDAEHLQRRFPGLRHPWICAWRDYDWAAAGHNGRGQQPLLGELGHFYDAHRAKADIHALAVLIASPASDGRAIAAHMVERAQRGDVRIAAHHAPFEVKDELKARGYRWNAARRVWTIDVAESSASAEIEALKAVHPRIMPGSSVIDWYNRHTG